MTHEFKSIVEKALSWKKEGKTTVLASVVYLEGSSYRKPGVRMLINQLGEIYGAVSGGCVEKEVIIQAQSVFQSGTPKMMTYDGRLRLGCEGVLYVLIEPLEISALFYSTFHEVLSQRIPFTVQSSYRKEPGAYPEGGTRVILDNKVFPLHTQKSATDGQMVFEEVLPPLFRLLIVGSEHDAVQLCTAAAQLGWEVYVIVAPDEQKTIDYFTGAQQLLSPINHQIDPSLIDAQTALVLMTHSYTKDVHYLCALKNTYPAYFGLLGPKKRKEQLIARLLEFEPDIELAFIDQFRGPAGINIGATSSQEIAISILAEILAVVRHQNPIPLRDKSGSIHA